MKEIKTLDRVKSICSKYNTTELHIFRLCCCGSLMGYTIDEVLQRLEKSTESYVDFSNEVMEKYEEIFGGE